MWPAGNGEVYFSCPVVKKMKATVMVDEGKVRRVRGIAYPTDQCVCVLCV